jgi:hypothetical protein
MKTVRPVILTLVALAGVVTADGTPTAASPTNTNTNSINSIIHNNTIELGPDIRCTPRSKDGVWSWYYNSKSDGPYSCSTKGGVAEWSMLSAYRSGGTEGVHWKYTENPNDAECLKDWKIYSSDGETVTATVSGRTTTQGGWRWCALPVYRSGGVYNKQWGDCWCQWE